MNTYIYMYCLFIFVRGNNTDGEQHEARLHHLPPAPEAQVTEGIQGAAACTHQFSLVCVVKAVTGRSTRMLRRPIQALMTSQAPRLQLVR